MSKYFANLSVLQDISFEVRRGEFFILVGPSGSGKSTLLRIMSRLETDYQGKVSWGSDIQPEEISFVFQQFALLPWLTVYENVELEILALKEPLRVRQDKIMAELTRFGLAKFASSYPRELSGGMKQRAGIARAFVRKPKIIFMDEPFSELDSFTAKQLRQEFLKIWKTSHETVIMVTHLIEEAVELADRIAVLTPRPAKLEKIIDNHLSRPRHSRTREFWQMEDELYRLVKP